MRMILLTLGFLLIWLTQIIAHHWLIGFKVFSHSWIDSIFAQFVWIGSRLDFYQIVHIWTRCSQTWIKLLILQAILLCQWIFSFGRTMWFIHNISRRIFHSTLLGGSFCRTSSNDGHPIVFQIIWIISQILFWNSIVSPLEAIWLITTLRTRCSLCIISLRFQTWSGQDVLVLLLWRLCGILHINLTRLRIRCLTDDRKASLNRPCRLLSGRPNRLTSLVILLHYLFIT